jgi:hypothetical protein
LADDKPKSVLGSVYVYKIGLQLAYECSIYRYPVVVASRKSQTLSKAIQPREGARKRVIGHSVVSKCLGVNRMLESNVQIDVRP